MRTWCFLFVIGAVVGHRTGFGGEHAPCQNDGIFPCVAAGKTTDDIADAALKIINERQAAIDQDPEAAVQSGLAKKYVASDGTVTYRPFGNTCKKFVQLLVLPQLKGVGLGPYYRDAYCSCGYEVSASEAVRGDIIQVSNDTQHEAGAEEVKLHTAIVLENIDNVWFDVIDSNYVNSFAMGKHRWDPQPWAKRLPGEYAKIKEATEKEAAQQRWDNEEKQHWNAHFYRLAPLPVAGTPSPPPPPPPPPPSTTTVGQFEPDATANPRISEVFQVSYAQYVDLTTGSNKLGSILDYPYVFSWGSTGVYVQMFRQPDTRKPRIGDGFNWLMYNPQQQWCNLLTSTFMATYFAVLGDEVYGVPMNDEHLWIGPAGLVLPGRNIYYRQDFSLGKTMLAVPSDSDGLEVRIIDWPAGPLRITSDVGAGGAIEPLTLTGWAVSNRQVYLRSAGGVELDQHGYRAWYVNGTYHSTTYMPELTIIGLEPGVTYMFRTEQVQNDVVETISNDLTLTMSPADEFSLHAELRMANAVSLSITNRRFVVVGYYSLLRDGVEIARLSGEASGDFDLEYSRTYTYEVVAMTASHMELGRTGTVAITTQPQPVTVQPPPDPARPTSIVLAIDRAEIPVFTKAQATAWVYDQYGRAMVGLRVLYLSSNPAVASIHADTGEVIAESVGTVQLHAELYDNRDLWSPPVSFTVHTADWTPSVPPVWVGINASQAISPDSAGRHISSPQHEAWQFPTSVSAPVMWVTFPSILYGYGAHSYYLAQHYSTDPEIVLPVNGFTWYPADGRLGVYFKTIHGCELWVNGVKVGEWGNPNGFGTQPINLPEASTINNPSLTLPPVEITPYLVAGTNYLVLHITAGSGAPELRHLEFVNLSSAPAINLPPSTVSSSGAVVFADDFNRAELGPDWEACGNVGLSTDGQITVAGDNSCTMCGSGSVAGIRRINFMAFPQPEATLELFVANDFGGRNNLISLAFGDFWVGATAHPQAQPVVQLFYRDHELTRATGTRLSPGWYELSISGGSARFHTLRLLNSGDPQIDLAASFADWIDSADPPNIDRLCLVGNELGQISFDDVTVRDLSVPAPTSPTTVQSNLVAALNLEVATVTADDQAVVGVKVSNLSPTACPASQLSLTVDGASERTFTVSELAASASQSFSVTLDRLAEGVHTVAIVADSNQQIAESDETDNGATLSFAVAPARRPDLQLALGIPAQGYIGELLPVTVTVPNLGDAASPPCLLNLGFGGTTEESIYDSETGPLQFIVPELAPGATVTFTSSLRLAAADTFTLWADVDANAEISELDETNNLASANFTVVPLPPNLTIASIAMVPSAPTTTDPVTFTMTVYNSGQSQSAVCQLTGTVTMVQLGFWGNLPAAEIPALAPGATTTVVVPGGPFPVPVPHYALFTADGTNLITEGKEDDNQKSIAFAVVDQQSDLAIGLIVVSRRDPTAISYSLDIKNVGAVAVPLADIVVQGLLSRDTVCGNADDRGAGGSVVASSGYLNPGQSRVVSLSCGFATAVDYLTYQYLTVKVDWSNKVVESNESNNTAAVRVALTGTTVFADNLESGLGRWRLNAAASGTAPVVGTHSSPYGGKTAANGTYVMYLGDSTSGTFATATAETTVNLAGYTQAVLEFDWSAYSLISPENIFLDVFDGGWQTAVVTTNASGWRHVSIDLSRFRLVNGMIIRFRSSMDYPESSDAAYVDNVKLTAK